MYLFLLQRWQIKRGTSFKVYLNGTQGDIIKALFRTAFDAGLLFIVDCDGHVDWSDECKDKNIDTLLARYTEKYMS